MFDYALEHGINAMIHDSLGSRRHYTAACKEALICLQNNLDLPFDERIDVVHVCDGNYKHNSTDPDHQNFQLAVRVGTNYDGVVSRETAVQLQNFIAPGVKPRWFLDRDEWQWSRAPRLDKLKGTSWLLLVVFSSRPSA